MKISILLISITGSLLVTATADQNTFVLAKELLVEKSYELSAVEFRRFAIESDTGSEQEAAYLYSSYAYLKSKDGISANEMLDRAENTGGSSQFINEHTLLSAESARLMRDTDTALYFYDVLSAGSESSGYQTFARRRSATIYFSEGNLESARTELKKSATDEARALEALEAYANGSDKSPIVGGLLGLIPGAGYWYSGEIANGFRSLILNSLFIFGMVHTAEEEQWGAFAVITFFEITWYSGSIYGGVDAAQRYNQDRLNTAIQGIESDMTYQPDPEVVVPLFKLNIHF
jgi:hypothetical protein